MASLAKVGTADRSGIAAAEDVAGRTETSDVGIGAQVADRAEGDRLSEQVEKRIMDIETGRVKMKRYTFDEYMRHLDDILGG